MDTKKVYELVGGDYDDALTRLRKPERIAKFLKFFLKDGSFAELKTSMENGDMEKAFAAAHTAKGVCANLSLEKLRAMVSDLTEDLRGGKDIEHARIFFPEVEACYQKTVETIREYMED